MTISTTQRKISYNGNGVTTAFAFPYRFLQNADINVILVDANDTETVQVLDTDFTVTGADLDAGGTVTMVVAPATGERLVIFREVELTQETDYISGDPFPAETHERALDKLAMADQQLQEQIDRTLLLGVAVPDNVSNELPNPSASTLIGWDTNGTALQNYDIENLGVSVSYAQWRTQQFSGDGSTTEFVLDFDAGAASNIDLSVGGVSQSPLADYTYTSSTQTITFTTAPPAATNNIVARYGQALPQAIPTIGDNTVELSKIETLGAGVVVGRRNAGPGNAEQLVVGGGLAAVGATLELADITGPALLGVETGTDTPSAISVGSGLSISAGVLEATAVGGTSSVINRIFNGKMEVAQRGTSFAAAATNTYTLDRWVPAYVTSAVVTISQQADAPSDNEFRASLRVAVTTADATIAAGDVFAIAQRIEGYNIRDLIGQDFTLSFRVRSAKTGVHCVAFSNSGNDRTWVAEYTISAADTWETHSVTVPGGLITAGTWNYTNGTGLQVFFTLAAGTTFQTTAGAWQTGAFRGTASQVNVLDTIGNIFAITGVQLAPGATASEFDHRPFSEELALCQRYGFGFIADSASYALAPAYAPTTTVGRILITPPVELRASPTSVTASATNIITCQFASGFVSSAIALGAAQSTKQVVVDATISGATANQPGYAYISTNGGTLFFNGAEL